MEPIKCEKCEDEGFILDICTNCNGSGEGMYDGSVCVICKGSGYTCSYCDCDKGKELQL